MKSASIKFKREYVRVLLSGLQSQEDLGFARELIDAGHATGNYQKSKGRADYGEIMAVLNFEITTQGRLFLDELNDALVKESWQYKTKIFFIWLFGLVGGFLLDLLKSWLTS